MSGAAFDGSTAGGTKKVLPADSHMRVQWSIRCHILLLVVKLVVGDFYFGEGEDVLLGEDGVVYG